MKTKKSKTEEYPKNTITLEGMSLYELCRWASLKEAVDIVADKCDERNIDFSTFELKPLDLLKYVDSMTDELFHKVSKTEEEKMAYEKN
jgi:hypothetical protein